MLPLIVTTHLNALARAMRPLGLLALLLAITGCAATGAAISHHDLSVQTKMSHSIFLPPAEQTSKTIYVATHNTADHPLALQEKLIDHLKQKGYRIVTNPNSAHYILQVNILQIGKLAPSAAEQSLYKGYGSALIGAGTGAVVGSAMSDGDTGASVAGGLVAGAASYVADHLVHDTTFSVLADLQIEVRLPKGELAKRKLQTEVQNGTATHEEETVHDQRNVMSYQTRLLSTANQVNLKFAHAAPVLAEQLATSISGLF